MADASLSGIPLVSCDPVPWVDPVTGVYGRSALLSLLFRETDRVQRMKTPLCVLLMEMDGFDLWSSQLGAEACDALLRQVVERLQRLLRSYDLLGRMGTNEFLRVLPGCSATDAALLAERVRAEVFAAPFRVVGESVQLSACFGIAASEGRSPVVVLREVEMALQQAGQAGAGSIRCFDNGATAGEPLVFLSSASGDESLAW
jgi:two-component system, cell cycle response regulator